jgi:hypothetical protein
MAQAATTRRHGTYSGGGPATMCAPAAVQLLSPSRLAGVRPLILPRNRHGVEREIARLSHTNDPQKKRYIWFGAESSTTTSHILNMKLMKTIPINNMYYTSKLVCATHNLAIDQYFKFYRITCFAATYYNCTTLG